MLVDEEAIVLKSDPAAAAPLEPPPRRKSGPKPGSTKGPRVDRGKVKGATRKPKGAGAAPPEELLGVDDIRVSEMRFADCFLRGMTYSNAYRETHDTHDLSDNVIANKASQLIKTARVKAYLDKVRSEKGNGIHVHVVPGVNDTSPIIALKDAMDAMKDSALLVTVQSQQIKMELIYWHAMASKNYAAAIGAAREQSELAGLKVDRKEITVKRMSDMSREEQAQALEDCRKEFIELGYDPSALEFNLEAAKPKRK